MQALFEAGVSRSVYCVNVDAVVAALLLKMLWQPIQRGEFAEHALETAAFTIFLYPRMLGCAAEIDDHMHGDDDQIVPYADSGPLSAKLLKNGTLKTYKGFPHGMQQLAGS